MADEKTDVGNPDRQRVNIHEEYEMRDWAKKFGVSKDQLRNAVQTVGTDARDVENYLLRHK
jgi:hypothetical protein